MSSRNTMVCTLGQFDIPILQKQPLFQVDILDKNIALFGAAMSGKTNFLKLLIQTIHMKWDETKEQVFILDFGGALAYYRDFPLVAAYFDNSNEEYVKRVFKILDEIMKRNTKKLNGSNFSSPEIKDMIHTTFIIDNLNAFQDEPRYQSYQEKLAKICRDGISKGVTVVVSASDTRGLTAYMSSFGQKVALEMPVDKYMDIFNTRTPEIGAIAGRGFANVTLKPQNLEGSFPMNAPYELQCYVAYPNDDTDFNNSLKRKFDWDDEREEYGKSVRKYLTFSGDLTHSEFNNLKQEPPMDTVTEDACACNVTVGLDYIDFFPVTVNVSEARVIGIYGKKEYGKTNLLRLILNDLFQKKRTSRFVFFDDGRKQLKEFYDKCESLGLECYSFAETQRGVVLPPKSVSPSEPDLMSGFTDLMDMTDTKSSRQITKKLTPFQQFYHFLNDNYIDLTWNDLPNGRHIHSPVSVYIYGEANAELMPSYHEEERPVKPTVFVLQSKMLYLSANGEKQFINNILPQLAALADEEDFIFIFTDIQKITDQESNNFFNNTLKTVFLLDNIAEFAGERGQKTVFGSMDVKLLREDYARCEIGDGYCYDIEADKLVKMKFIKEDM